MLEQCHAHDVAALLAEKDAEIERLKEAIERQRRAAKCLDSAKDKELCILRERDQKAQAAIISLDSEKSMNARLTAENQRLVEILGALDEDDEDGISNVDPEEYRQ